MADTYTTNLNLTKPEPGAAEDTWGISLNSDLDTLDAIFSSSGTQVNLNPNQVNFADNKKAIFGTGSDLQIYHDGSSNHSIIAESGAGSLFIRGQSITMQNADGSKAYFGGNGDVATAYYGTSAKFATSSSGIDVTGTVTSDGLVIDTNTGSFNDDAKLEGLVGDIRFNYTQFGGSGNYGGSIDFYTKESSTARRLRQKISLNGDISFYDDTGTTQGLFWDASAESLGIGLTNPSEKLEVSGKIKASGQIRAGSYLESFPSFSFANDTDTGMFSDTANQLEFSTGGSSRLVIDSSGNVGINTTSPSEKLHVEGRIRLGTTPAIVSHDNITIDIDQNNNSGSNYFRVTHDGESSELFRVQENGNVGIGTDSPNAKLSIHAAVNNPAIEIVPTTDDNNADSAVLRLWGTRFGTANRYSEIRNVTDGSTANNELAFNTNGSERMRIDSSGKVGIGETSPDSKLHVNAGGSDMVAKFESTDAGSYINIVDSGSGSYGAMIGVISDDIILSPNNVEAVRIDSSGNVGIGATAPSAALHVDGDALIKKNIFSSGDSVLKIQNGGNTGNLIDAQVWNGSAFETSFVATQSGNVGIGTDSPSSLNAGANRLVVGGGANFEGLSVYSAVEGGVYFADGTTGSSTYSGVIKYVHSDNSMQFTTNATERMRITSSGELLLNKTSASVGTDGVQLRPSSYSGFSATSTTALFVNRNTDDGDVVEIGKNGVKVGSIGVNTDRPYFARTEGGFSLSAAGHFIPATSNGSVSDNARDIGLSNARWRNLHLSGTAYIGTQLGLGTTNPGATLDVTNASGQAGIDVDSFTNNNSYISFKENGTSRFSINHDTSGNALTIYNSYGSSEAMRIDSSGNVGIGTTTPNYLLDVEGSGSLLRVNSTSGNSIVQLSVPNTTSITGVNFGDSGSTNAGYIWYRHTGDSMAFTTAGAEAMRIDSSGHLLVGKTTTAIATEGAEIRRNGFARLTVSDSTCLQVNRITGTGTAIDLRYAGTSVGSIVVNASSTTYNTSSDARLKDVTGEARGLEVITKLNPVAYNWKADGKADEGLIAQEVKEIVPNAVSGSEDEHYQMDYSKLVTHLVAGMKEQQEQIESLKSEIAKLKGE